MIVISLCSATVKSPFWLPDLRFRHASNGPLTCEIARWRNRAPIGKTPDDETPPDLQAYKNRRVNSTLHDGAAAEKGERGEGGVEGNGRMRERGARRRRRENEREGMAVALSASEGESG
ncbi:hypothetical protein TIFTF001_022326 [Ficus carica]|uniref:Uncharacterized protein n=1 Tax=Ficus carica TaxID=3494 RepID=A0AA88ALU8_FICCA|nr:hypothetical protein TIFTF001_022326 [Ficus carica]